MSEAALLRVLADRLDEFESLKLFPADITDPGTVTVALAAGNDHPGYEALSQAVSAMVEQHWNALRSQVLKKKETEVQSARKAWSDIGVETVAEAVEPEADAGTTLPQAPQQLSRMQLVQRQA